VLLLDVLLLELLLLLDVDEKLDGELDETDDDVEFDGELLLLD